MCANFEEVRDVVRQYVPLGNGKRRSYIIQKYITQPFLFRGRKFDIRTFVLVTSVNGNLRAYFYEEGYLRTSSKEFSLSNQSRMVHLTNDAVQKKGDQYGKFESGNKLSYHDFQRYLENLRGFKNRSFFKEVLPQIREISSSTIKASFSKMDPKRRHHSFELLGYDFMIDESLKVYLIEVNSNPCFALSSPYLARLIPGMIENALKIAVDPIFPPPPWPAAKRHLLQETVEAENKFTLIFDEQSDAADLGDLSLDSKR